MGENFFGPKPFRFSFCTTHLHTRISLKRKLEKFSALISLLDGQKRKIFCYNFFLLLSPLLHGSATPTQHIYLITEIYNLKSEWKLEKKSAAAKILFSHRIIRIESFWSGSATVYFCALCILKLPQKLSSVPGETNIFLASFSR